MKWIQTRMKNNLSSLQTSLVNRRAWGIGRRKLSFELISGILAYFLMLTHSQVESSTLSKLIAESFRAILIWIKPSVRNAMIFLCKLNSLAEFSLVIGDPLWHLHLSMLFPFFHLRVSKRMADGRFDLSRFLRGFERGIHIFTLAMFRWILHWTWKSIIAEPPFFHRRRRI